MKAEQIIGMIASYNLQLSYSDYGDYPPWTASFAEGLKVFDGYSAEDVMKKFSRWVLANAKEADELRQQRDEQEYVRLSKKFGTFA